MSVQGPLAFRSMMWTRDDEGELKVSSPYMTQYSWPEKWAWAECTCGHCERTDPPYDNLMYLDWPLETIIPKDHSRCGMWSTIREDIILNYYHTQGCVVFLVELLGDYLIYEDVGTMRSAGVELIAVVNYGKIKENGKRKTVRIENNDYEERKLAPTMLSAMAAASYYEIPMHSLEASLIAVKTQWLKLGLDWPARTWASIKEVV